MAYELRTHPRGWAIVHIRSGQIIELCRTRNQGQQLLARYNTQP